MIDPLPGWTWDLRATGIVLTHPTLGRIHYRERVMPMRTASAILRALPAIAGSTAIAPPVVERARTREDELAAIATIDGEAHSRAVGIVWLDDWYAVIDAHGDAGERDARLALVRRLVESDAHLRGDRRRRFLYRPPAGWRGALIPPYHAYWLHPAFPREPTSIAVFPAIPRAVRELEPAALVATLGGLAPGAQAPARVTHAMTNAHGLVVHELEAAVDDDRVRAFVVLEDRRYYYPILLETTAAHVATHTPTLRALVQTVEPFAIEVAAPALGLELWPE